MISKFILRCVLFLIFILSILIVGIFLPTKNKIKDSFLSAQIEKDSMLLNTPSPKFILIGGSSGSFGNNSQIFKDSLRLNPINTSINAAIGLKYMLYHTLNYIQKGDIVIVIPEYDQFYGDLYYGNTTLLQLLFEVPGENKTISLFHLFKVAPYFFTYTSTKYNFKNYIFEEQNNIIKNIYARNSFNIYGDAVAHWGLKRQHFIESDKIQSQFNKKAIIGLKKFENEVLKKGGEVFISFPGVTEESFDINIESENYVYSQLITNNFKVLGNPKDFRYSDTLAFNSTSHLNKAGADLHSKQIVKFLNEFLNKR